MSEFLGIDDADVREGEMKTLLRRDCFGDEERTTGYHDIHVCNERGESEIEHFPARLRTLRTKNHCKISLHPQLRKYTKPPASRVV